MACNNKLLLFLLCSILYAAPSRKPPPISVALATAEKSELINYKVYLGSVKSKNTAKLSLEVTGVVDKILVPENSFVKKGQIILTVNSNLIKAQLDAAAARLKLARKSALRSTELFKSKSTSDSQYDKAMSELAEAKSQFDLYEAKLEQTILRAPFSGYISSINQRVGDFIGIGIQITQINDLDHLKVEFYVPQEVADKINNKSKIFASINSKFYPLNTIVKETIVSENTRLVKFSSDIAANIRPGSFAIVKVAEALNSIMVPETAIKYDASGAKIFRYVNGVPLETQVELGSYANGLVEVKSGLKEHEKYVAVGQFKIYKNAEIIVVK